MDYGNLLDVARRRRSIRRYTKEPVSSEAILKILEVGRWAPSASNSQPWEWIVVTDREKLSKIHEILSDYITLIRKNNPKFPAHSVDYLKDISATIIVAVDERVRNAWSTVRADHLLQVSMGAGIQNVLLAATALGIGSVWVSGASEPKTQEKIKRILNIPDQVSVYACIPLGYPDRPPKTRHRRRLDDTVHWNRFEMNKRRHDDEMEPKALWKLMSEK